jgi:hypothetical protein
VVLTSKPERVPLNSGLSWRGEANAARLFSDVGEIETLEILRTPEVFAQANDPAEPYGGRTRCHFIACYLTGRRPTVTLWTCDGQTAAGSGGAMRSAE